MWLDQHTDSSASLQQGFSSVPAMEEPRKLDLLPSELVAEIAFLLDGRDVLALRHVCRQVAAAVDDTFVNEFFTQRVHLCTLQSLEVLANIASNARLIRKIHKITFIAQAPTESSLDFMLRDERPVRETQSELQGSRPQKQAQELQKKHALQTWQEQMSMLEAKEYDVELLSQIFRGVAGRHATAPMKVKITNSCPRELYGLAALKKTLGFGIKTYGLHACQCDRLVRSVLSAMTSSKVKVDQLRLGPHVRDLQVAFSALSVRKDDLNGALDLFKNLTVLKMGIYQHCDRIAGDRSHDDTIAALLGSATQLTSLSIGGNPCEEDVDFDEFARMTAALAAPSLQKLMVNGFFLRQDQLAEVLTRHKSSLQNVELQSLCLDEDDCWIDLMAAIARDLKLQVLDICNLMRGPDKEETFVSSLDGSARSWNFALLVEGAEEMDESLDAIIQHGYYLLPPDLNP